ncbi:MAG: ComEC/Rec2 family competence protein [Desulfobaccales bacterium]
MTGIGAASWGVALPRAWAVPVLAGLGLGLLWGWWTDRRLLLLPLVWFFLTGAAFHEQGLQPVFPPEHVTRLPLHEELTLRGRLAQPPRAGPAGLQLILQAEAWLSPQGWQPATGPVLVHAPPGEAPPLGREAVLRGKLSAPRRLNNPGAADRPRNLAREGIFRTVSLRDPGDLVWLATPEMPLKERLRGGLRSLLVPYPVEIRALYRALLLGEQGEITREMREALSRTGTAHLVAISGLHLGMAAAITYALVFWLLRRVPWLLLRLNAIKAATVAAAVPVVGYAWLAGGSPATQRAEVMVLAYLAAVLLGRAREVVSALALAALVILAFNPLRLFSPSFALSFIAVAGLLALLPRWSVWLPRVPPEHGLRTWWPRLKRWLPEAFLASLAASLATAPLVAWFFNILPLLGFLVNLAAIPLVLGVGLPLGELAALSQMLGLTFAARVLLDLGQWPLWLGWQIIDSASRIPGAAVLCPTPTFFQLAVAYGGIACLALPGGGRLAYGGAALAALVLFLTVAVPRAPSEGVTVTVLDHPGGLAATVEVPDGRRLLVSAGWPPYPGRGETLVDVVPRYLHYRHIRRLTEVAVLTLTPANAAELLEVAGRFPAPTWTMAWPREPSPAGVALVNLLGDEKKRVRRLGQEVPPETWGPLKLRYLPLREAAALELKAYSRRVVLLPPVAMDHLELPAAAAAGWDAVVAPRLPPPDAPAAPKARRWVLYGGRGDQSGPRSSPAASCHTHQGAVTLRLTPAGVQVSQETGR